MTSEAEPVQVAPSTNTEADETVPSVSETVAPFLTVIVAVGLPVPDCSTLISPVTAQVAALMVADPRTLAPARSVNVEPARTSSVPPYPTVSPVSFCQLVSGSINARVPSPATPMFVSPACTVAPPETVSTPAPPANGPSVSPTKIAAPVATTVAASMVPTPFTSRPTGSRAGSRMLALPSTVNTAPDEIDSVAPSLMTTLSAVSHAPVSRVSSEDDPIWTPTSVVVVSVTVLP